MILPQEAWERWLGEEPAEKEELQALLKPFPSERMRAYPVSTRVNSPKNDVPELIEAVGLKPGAGVAVKLRSGGVR